MECFSSRVFSKESTTSPESTGAVKQLFDVIDNVFLLCFFGDVADDVVCCYC